MRSKHRLFWFVGCALFFTTLTQAQAQPGDPVPQVQGWSVGLAADTIERDVLVGVRAGYWHEHLGVDARLQFSALAVEETEGSTTLDERVRAIVLLGGKGGYQVGAAKWFGRLGVGLEVDEQRFEGTNVTKVMGLAELGGGVDFAVSDRLLLGLTLLNLRALVGEYSISGEPNLDFAGGQASILSGGHVSYQF